MGIFELPQWLGLTTPFRFLSTLYCFHPVIVFFCMNPICNAQEEDPYHRVAAAAPLFPT